MMIPYFETHITEACNLNCRGCSHFSVLAKPKHKDLGEFEKEMKRMAEIEELLEYTGFDFDFEKWQEQEDKKHGI